MEDSNGLQENQAAEQVENQQFEGENGEAASVADLPPVLNSLGDEQGSQLQNNLKDFKEEEAPNLKNIPVDSIKLKHCYGFPSHKRNNIHFIEDQKTISCMGNILIVLDMRGGEIAYYEGTRKNSFGAIAVHPSKKYIAVGEVACSNPNIFIYSYPNMEIIKILKNGADRGYGDICFNPSGDKLASVALDPDYTLTIWNWSVEQILNRSKAFSQDVYRVNFSPDMEGILTTSGMGHIKFWRLADTFTGLKLQGYLGKFGASELSDIEAFIQLPDGKVLSSTETGNLLLWDGGMIKCEIGVKGKKPCHQGRIEVLVLQEGEIITGGEDGYFKIWDLETIDTADVNTTGAESGSSSAAIPRIFEMEPMDEILISKEVKKLDPSGTIVVAGFADGVIRFITIGAAATSLISVHKPHNSAITAVAFSNNGKYFATAGKDSKVFLFSIEPKSKQKDGRIMFENSTVNPIGFIKFNGTPIDLSFGEDEFEKQITKTTTATFFRLFITLDDGSMLIANIPEKISFDSSSSYEIPDGILEINPWKLKVPASQIKPPLQSKVHEGGESEKVENENDKSKVLEKSKSLNTLRKERGLSITENSSIWNVIGIMQDFFIVNTTNIYDESEIRLCSLQNASFSQLLAIYDRKITYLKLDSTRQFILVGDNYGFVGMVRCSINMIPSATVNVPKRIHDTYESFQARLDEKIIAIEEEIRRDTPAYDLQTTLSSVIIDGQTWMDHLHDLDHGRITAVCSSFDSSYLISSATDGAIFIRRNAFFATEDGNSQSLATQLNLFAQVEDITDPNAYSLQDAKIKSKKDRETQAAERKKKIMREKIAAIRKEFDEIVQDVANQPTVKIDRSELIADITLKDNIEEESKLRKANLVKELAWNAAKELLGVDKLRKKFLEPIQTERIKVNSFKTKQTVATFRTAKLNFEKDPVIDNAMNSALGDASELGPSSRKTTGEGAKSKKLGNAVEVQRRTPKTQNTAKKIDVRKQQRAERAAIWKALIDSKPDEKYQDPQDVLAIRNAISNMGDYKLKTADDYVVPEQNRIDADKKKREITLLSKSIFSLKEDFNKRVFNLRNKKVDIINLFREHNQKIQKLNEDLEELDHSQPFPIFQPVIEDSAFPENREIVSDKDIKAEKELFEKLTKKNETFGFSIRPNSGGQDKEENSGPISFWESLEKLCVVPQAKVATAQSISTGKATPISKLQQIKMVRQKRKIQELKNERHALVAKLNEQVNKFDKILSHLVHDRMILVAEIKLQLLFNEWLLLKEFEQTDIALNEKLAAKIKEKEEIEVKITEYRDKLNDRKVEIDKIIEIEREIHELFRATIGESNKNEEYLLKVFKRKIKRTKKKNKDGEDDEEEESEEEFDDSSYDSESDAENEEFEEACPPDLNQSVWQKVLELRERRLDQEEALLELQKIVELLKKENDSLLKKEKGISLSLKNTRTEIQDFQTQKQRKLNELDVAVPLRLSQIQHLENDKIPTDLSQCIVFFNEGLERLNRRIKELHEEKIEIKKQHRELKKQHVTYVKSKKEKQAKLVELSAKSREVQMLKFGQLVDLEKLEKLGSNKVADELQEKIRNDDIARQKEITALDEAVKTERLLLMEATKENTLLLENTLRLAKQKESLEQALDFKEISAGNSLSGPSQKELEEREKLIMLVEGQNRHIDALKTEIESLIRKPTAAFFRSGVAPSSPKPTVEPSTNGDLESSANEPRFARTAEESSSVSNLA